MKKIVFLFIAVLVLMLFNASDTFACSCGRIRRIPVESLEKQEDYAMPGGEVVFSGKVLSIRKNFIFVHVTFKVHKVWKGEIPQTVTIFTGDGNGNCGFSFKKGENYLVDASRGEDNIPGYTSTCTRTARMIDAAETLKLLGNGRAPSSKNSLQ